MNLDNFMVYLIEWKAIFFYIYKNKSKNYEGLYY